MVAISPDFVYTPSETVTKTHHVSAMYVYGEEATPTSSEWFEDVGATVIDGWTPLHFAAGMFTQFALAYFIKDTDIALPIAMTSFLAWEAIEHVVMKPLSGAGGREDTNNIVSDTIANSLGALLVHNHMKKDSRYNKRIVTTW